MKKIKINFEDFYPGFKKDDNLIISILRKKYDIEISENPDYLFFGCFGYNFLKYKCIRIFYTGEDVSPDFNFCDYAIAFDDINFGDRYRRFPLCVSCENYPLALQKHNFTQAELNKKQRFCNFVYSNSNANPKREQFFKQLSEYKKVDSGGRYLNNIDGPVADKHEFQKKISLYYCF